MFVLAAAVQAERPAALQALHWTDRGHAREVLLEQPATCLDPAAPQALVRAGEALFNSPAVLGGQAERAGMSCASCHANGRRSQWFRLDGVSAGPGSADVSSSFFSIQRANARFDPQPIPDLALPGRVPHDPVSGQLEAFVRGLIVEEFSGAEPSARSLAALSGYIRAVRTCSGRSSEPRGIAADLRLVEAGTTGAIELLNQGDRDGAIALVKGTRFRLGLISERMAGRQLVRQRRDLLTSSRELALQQEAPEAGGLMAWQSRFDRKLRPSLVKAEPRSLYAPAAVDRWLRARP